MDVAIFGVHEVESAQRPRATAEEAADVHDLRGRVHNAD